MKRILIIRLKAIGDVVLTLPAVNVVRENFPAAKITFLTSQENVELLRGFCEVNEVITLDRTALRSGNPLKVIRVCSRLLHQLRKGKFDLVVDLHGYGETAWLTRLTGARARWGEINRSSRSWAYTRPIEQKITSHAAKCHLETLEACGLKIGSVRNEFSLPVASANDARAWFIANRLEVAKPTLYLQPFTSEMRKNWPFEKHLALANYWQTRGVQIIVGGGPADKPLLEQARSLGFAVSAGLSKLTDAGLMQFSTLIVGGDTGFLHLAVALGRRVIMLMNSQSPGNAVPFQHPDWVIVPHPGEPLASVTLETVIEAAGTALTTARI